MTIYYANSTRGSRRQGIIWRGSRDSRRSYVKGLIGLSKASELLEITREGMIEKLNEKGDSDKGA